MPYFDWTGVGIINGELLTVNDTKIVQICVFFFKINIIFFFVLKTDAS